ncbi:hypothetical protein CIB95_10940 [Lottiidibacillus patelloidae]|uniref:Uncharacterized protein n=1 Tax=Lottiidibacillus patelloidae TaxID=2670334 RepID=A0A263BSR0_9BACI|nr:hypothetical protein [Lottiidibacillus patelloidae]OZM56729.1 hypothetical protein CIB95_10940 [Lottiidibacillus patelloidae]
MKKRYYILVLIVLFPLIYSLFSGFGFTAASTITGKHVLSKDTVYGKAILFEDPDLGTFGVARIESVFHLLYKYSGESTDQSIEKDKPFAVTGFGTSELDGKDGFLLAIKTSANSSIQYITVGNHLGRLHTSSPYSMTLDDVRANQEYYDVEEVTNNYTLFVLDSNDHNRDKYIIRGFDSKGKLIADKLWAAKIRYVNK